MHPQTLLAYEMNGEPLKTLHGAPLRLRVENQLGFKMVKWIRAIEFGESHKAFGEGEGGVQRGPRVLRRAGQHLTRPVSRPPVGREAPSRIKENFEVSAIPEEAVREISEGIKSRVRFNAVVETGVPGFIPRRRE